MDITEFFEGKCVVITGVTGFIGKVLLEKIIYSCPGVKKTYVLIRKSNPRQKTPRTEDRFQELLSSRAFDRIRKERPNDLKKIHPIWSDIEEPGLGISETDREELVRNASIVFHSAASTRFMSPLKTTLKTNLFATRMLLTLFKQFETKDAFIYISTAFCHTHVSLVEEIIYDLPVSLDYIIEGCKNLNNDGMDSLFPFISDGRHNRYFLSKAVTEKYLDEHCNGLPVAIVRPSIVGHSLEEPKPGWGDSNNYVATACYVVGHGLVHNFPMDPDGTWNVVPVDKVCSLSIAVAASLQQIPYLYLKNQLPVYNSVCDFENEITFKDIHQISMRYVELHPSTRLVCYPHSSLSRHKIKLQFGKIFHHYIPALFLDLLRKLKGKKAKYYKLYRKYFSVVKDTAALQKMNVRFVNENSKILFKQLTPEDQKTFNFEIVNLNWREYLFDWYNGLRYFFFPDDKICIESGKRKLKWLFWRFVCYEISIAVTLTAAVVIPLYISFF